MDRVFLDANVLFSAAYRADSGLLRFWQLENIELISSVYAVEEARRNLDDPAQLARLDSLGRKLEIVGSDIPSVPIIENLGLPEKDFPILCAAVTASATHLVTGDVRHFGHLFGTAPAGVLVLLPAQYFHHRNHG